MRAGGGQRDLARAFERVYRASHRRIIRGFLVFVVFVIAFVFGGARIRLAHALRQRRVVEPRLARLAGLELDRGQRFDFDHRARRAPRGPARLIEQRGIDEQRVAAPDPLVERAELVAAEHLDAGQREDQQIAARRQRRDPAARCNARGRSAPRRRNAAATRTVRRSHCRDARRWSAARCRHPDRATAPGAATGRRTRRAPPARAGKRCRVRASAFACREARISRAAPSPRPPCPRAPSSGGVRRVANRVGVAPTARAPRVPASESSCARRTIAAAVRPSAAGSRCARVSASPNNRSSMPGRSASGAAATSASMQPPAPFGRGMPARRERAACRRTTRPRAAPTR